MSANEYKNWLKAAFCYCEAALLEEMATPSHLCISEELVRSAFVRGLSHAKPSAAGRITTESQTKYSTNTCWGNSSHGGAAGRPIQNDISIKSIKKGGDAEIVFEVKWIKKSNPDEVLKDVWKLAFSLEARESAKSKRAFLLLGGERGELGKTLNSLRKSGVDFRWSKAGRQTGNPKSRNLSMGKLFGDSKGRRAFDELLGWGTDHVREPPKCWYTIRVSREVHWLKTLTIDAGKSINWVLILFEFTAWGVKSGEIDWDKTKSEAVLKCENKI